MTAMDTNAPKPYLGRCKDCDYSLFTAAEDITQADNAVAGGPAVNIGNGQIMGRCNSGHRWFMLKRIKGTYSEAHECDSRCMNAKGHSCTCSCGGLNHGRGHAATIVAVAPSVAPNATPAHTESTVPDAAAKVVASPQAPSTVGRHLGEVGKNITGNVTVERVAIHAGNGRDYSTPYVFRSDKGDEIVWFAPKHADPFWAVGVRFKLRAKVKAHQSHPRFGNSTVVTYVERIN